MSEKHQPHRPLMTVSEVAERLNVSASLIYQLADSGKLPVCRIGNGRGTVRFRPQDIEHYIDSCRKETNSLPARKPRPRLKHIHL